MQLRVQLLAPVLLCVQILGLQILGGQIPVLRLEHQAVLHHMKKIYFLLPLMLHAIWIANMTIPVALLIGIAILQLVRRANASSALAIILGILTKYVTIALLPLAFIMRRWSVLLWSAVFSAMIGTASLGVMKWEPFKTYQREIAPTLTRHHDITTNQSITAFLLRATHREVLPRGIQFAVLGVEGIALLALLWLLLKQPPAYWEQPANVFAAAMALLTFLLVISPVFWEHYPVYLCPLWGWLLWEARQSRGMAIGAILAVALTYIPFTAWLNLGEPYNTHILPSALCMFGLAAWRLLKISHLPIATSKSLSM